MTYGHLRADCLYTGISSGPNARYRVWESLYLYLLWYQNYLNIYVVQTESDADEYLSVMREKQFSLPLFSPICIYMLKYSLFGNFKLFVLILDHENIAYV